MLIIETDIKWRCVFSEQRYKEGDTIEICQYIRIPNEQIPMLKNTIINHYWFWLNGDKGEALIFLGNGSLYNHSKDPNMMVVMESDGRVGFVAIKDIEPLEELVFDYGYQPDFKIESNLKLLHKNQLNNAN